MFAGWCGNLIKLTQESISLVFVIFSASFSIVLCTIYFSCSNQLVVFVQRTACTFNYIYFVRVTQNILHRLNGANGSLNYFISAHIVKIALCNSMTSMEHELIYHFKCLKSIACQITWSGNRHSYLHTLKWLLIQ